MARVSEALDVPDPPEPQILFNADALTFTGIDELAVRVVCNLCGWRITDSDAGVRLAERPSDVTKARIVVRRKPSAWRIALTLLAIASVLGAGAWRHFSTPRHLRFHTALLVLPALALAFGMAKLSETLVGGFSTKETAEMLYVLKRMRGLDVDGAKSTPRCIVLRQGSDPTVFDKKDD